MVVAAAKAANNTTSTGLIWACPRKAAKAAMTANSQRTGRL